MSFADSRHVLQFMTMVAVDKHFSMMNDKADGFLLGTRASGTGTPTLGSELIYSTFLKQDDCFHFDHDKAYYNRLLEEKDDTVLHWYPMYIRYSNRNRALKINETLLAKGYETYLHLQEAPKDGFGNPQEGTLLGPIYNMVFVHAMKIQLKLLKRFVSECNRMIFMTAPHSFETSGTEIIWVPDKQMRNFIEAATRPDPESQRIPLTYNEFIKKEGKKVKIMRGPLMGVEGEIKRVGRHRIVVALLRDAQVAVGITHVPPSDMIFLDN